MSHCMSWQDHLSHAFSAILPVACALPIKIPWHACVAGARYAHRACILLAGSKCSSLGYTGAVGSECPSRAAALPAIPSLHLDACSTRHRRCTLSTQYARHGQVPVHNYSRPWHASVACMCGRSVCYSHATTPGMHVVGVRSAETSSHAALCVASSMTAIRAGTAHCHMLAHQSTLFGASPVSYHTFTHPYSMSWGVHGRNGLAFRHTRQQAVYLMPMLYVTNRVITHQSMPPC